MLEHIESFRDQRRTAELFGALDAFGDQRLLRAALAMAFDGRRRHQISDVFEHAECGNGDRTFAVERHVVEKARLTAGLAYSGHRVSPSCSRAAACRRRPPAGSEIGLERRRHGAVSIEGRIAGALDAGQSALLQPAARHIHVGAGTEPDKETLHAFGRKQIDETPDAFRPHPCFGAAQIDAIEVGGCVGCLTTGIDGDVTTAEGRAVELSPHQAVRPAPCIQPGGKPPQFQRQADLVHCAPREHRLLAYPSQFS